MSASLPTACSIPPASSCMCLGLAHSTGSTRGDSGGYQVRTRSPCSQPAVPPPAPPTLPLPAGGPEFLAQYGAGLVQVLAGFIGNVKERGTLVLQPVMDLVVQVGDDCLISLCAGFRISTPGTLGTAPAHPRRMLRGAANVPFLPCTFFAASQQRHWRHTVDVVQGGKHWASALRCLCRLCMGGAASRLLQAAPIFGVFLIYSPRLLHTLCPASTPAPLACCRSSRARALRCSRPRCSASWPAACCPARGRRRRAGRSWRPRWACWPACCCTTAPSSSSSSRPLRRRSSQVQ